jgi:mono/diheme cytochrome c family protein
MKRALAGIGLAIAVLAIAGGFALWRAVRYGFSAHDQPTKMEALMAGKLRRWSTPTELRRMRNPVALAPEALAEARAHFADHCASCHGNDGKGETQIGRRLYPRAPDMTLPATQALSDGELFAIIENGIRLTGMPGWGEGTAESAYGSWTLVHFIRHLPDLTPEEIAEMVALNPISPAEMQAAHEEEKFLASEDAPKTESSEHHH